MGMLNQAWVPSVFEIFRKVFNAGTFTLEQEKRLKAVFNRAPTEDIALEAIDLIYGEGVRYPTAKELRDAIDRTYQRVTMQAPMDYGSGPYVTFRDWYAAQDADMQARVRRVFPSLKVEL